MATWLRQARLDVRAPWACNANLLLTQEFLAEMLGVRRTTVTLLAQELQKRGILRYSRGRITYAPHLNQKV
jgi:CRP-like cAMP-binding protein